MPREKRKDMKDIRAFSMPQMNLHKHTQRAAVFLPANALEKFANIDISCTLPPVRG